MRVAVITPYYRESLDILRHCHESVRHQTHSCEHFMVADGFPSQDVAGWTVQHISLSQPHQDVGNTPRGIGALSAVNQGFDAIAFLDADNWYYPQHIEEMLRLHRKTGAAVCTASRTIHRLDGSLMFADRESDGDSHVDTSCFFVTRPAFAVLPLWATMPTQLGPIGDRFFWHAIKARKLACAQCEKPTVAFRTQYECHYASLGETPPAGARSKVDAINRAWVWWRSQSEEARRPWDEYFIGMQGNHRVSANAIGTAKRAVADSRDAADSRHSIYREFHCNQLMSEQTRYERAATVILELLFQHVHPKSILDVGCGLGTWLAVARRYGVRNVQGIEGPWLQRDLLEVSAECVEIRDLERPFDLGRNFDLVICLEVGEHLSKGSAAPFVRSIAAHGEVVLFSAAIPYQGGSHHVNEQWLEYWSGLFAEAGFLALDFIRPAIWCNAEIPWWLRQNTLLYVHKDALTRMRGLACFICRGWPSQLRSPRPVYGCGEYSPSHGIRIF